MTRLFTGPQGRDPFRNRLLRLMVVRLVLVTLLFAAATVELFRHSGYYGRVLSAYSIVIAAYTFSTIYAAALQRVENLKRFAYFQFLVDAVCIAASIRLVGDSAGVFPQLFVLHILGSGYMLGTAGALGFASLDAVLYVALVLLDPVPGDHDGGPLRWLFDGTPHDVLTLTRMSTNVLAFYLTAFVSGSLSRRVEESEAALESAGASLQTLRELHGGIVENIRSGILTTDTRERITSFNRAAERITGTVGAEVIGRALEEMFPEADNRVRELPPADTWLSSTAGTWEQWYRPGSERRPVYLRFAVSDLRDERGGRVGRILIFDDITRLRQVEERLEREERLVALGKVAAGIVHEVRNPLASISGAVQLLKDESRISEEDRGLMEIVVREADRLNALVTNFLGFARSPAPRMVPARVGAIAREVLQMARTQGWSAHGVEILDAVADDTPVMADPDQMRQVVWNLVNNAIQAMSVGGRLLVGTRRVQGLEKVDPTASGAFHVGPWFELRVRDTGIGMDPEQQARVFDPFVTHRSGGTGLGLALVQRIVEAHSGRILLDSAPGEGTTFRVLLPIHEDETPQSADGTGSSIEEALVGAPAPEVS